MFISNRPGRVKPGSSGEIIPGCDAKVVDDNGMEVPVGEIGNLRISSDAVCLATGTSTKRRRKSYKDAGYARATSIGRTKAAISGMRAAAMT